MPDEKTSISLLRIKLHRPRGVRTHFHRQHLPDRLDRSLQRPLMLVSAPAGYGKSTLLSCWIEASYIPGARVSLDENDNNQHLFLAYSLPLFWCWKIITHKRQNRARPDRRLLQHSVGYRQLIFHLIQV